MLHIWDNSRSAVRMATHDMLIFSFELAAFRLFPNSEIFRWRNPQTVYTGLQTQQKPLWGMERKTAFAESLLYCSFVGVRACVCACVYKCVYLPPNVHLSSTEVDDMIRKSTNLLLTRTLSHCLHYGIKKKNVGLAEVLCVCVCGVGVGCLGSLQIISPTWMVRNFQAIFPVQAASQQWQQQTSCCHCCHNNKMINHDMIRRAALHFIFPKQGWSNKQLCSRTVQIWRQLIKSTHTCVSLFAIFCKFSHMFLMFLVGMFVFLVASSWCRWS